MRPLRPRAALAVAAALALSCAHPQEEGAYALTATEVIRDNCGLLADPETLWDGRLQITGEVVWLDFDLFEMQLRGRYKEVSDDFYVDGSAANVLADVQGESCQLDLVTVRLEGAYENPSAFTGTVRVEYQDESLERCQCELWAAFRADKTGN